MNYTNGLKIDTSEMDRAIREAKNNLKVLAQEISRTRLNTVDYNTAMESLNSNLDEQQKKVNALEDKYELLRSSLGENAQQTKNVQAELEKEKNKLIEAKNAIYNYNQGMSSASTECKNMCHALTQLEMAVYDVTKTIATIACRALVNFTKETINTGMQFESAFAGVKKVVNGTENDFKELEQEIRQTSLEKPISADQLASVYQMGAQLGIAKADLKDFSNTIIDLKNTSDLTEEAGATMIAQYANVKDLKSSDYKRFTSTLSYLGSTTATTESKIMSMAQRMSGTAAVMKMADKDVLALSTAMTSVGIEAELGGSAISKIMMNIEEAVKGNTDKLSVWASTAKMSVYDFANLWKSDTLGAIQKVMKGLSDSKAGGESLVLMLKDLGIENIRTTQTMMQLSSASDLLTDCMQKANNEWEKATFLGESANEVYNTVDAKMQLLKNSFSEMQISIYEGFKEPLAEAMKELSNLLKSDDAKKFAKEFANIINNVVKLAVSLIRALITNFDKVILVAKGLTRIIAAIITQKIITTVLLFVSAIQRAGSVMAWFNTIVAANPLGLLATVISAVIVGLAEYAIKCATATNALKEHTKVLEEENKQLIEDENARKKVINGIESETERTKGLVDELKNLVDENGKVKEGQEERLKSIIPILQEATGTEINLINGQINKYHELIRTLDDVIEKKRLEALMEAYKDDYGKALRAEKEAKEEEFKNMSMLAAKEKELAAEMKRRQNGQMVSAYGAIPTELKNEIEELRKQKELLDENKKKRDEIINTYEGYLKEKYDNNNFESKGQNLDQLNNQEKMYREMVDNYRVAVQHGSKEITYEMVKDAEDKLNSVQQKIKEMRNFASGQTNGQGFSFAGDKKEETKTTYQELLNQEKAYGEQLNDYLSKVKDANSGVTVEMVQDTKKKLDEVQKKVKEMKELLDDNTVTSKLVLNDETYGGLTKKRQELKEQLSQLQTELSNGNQSITQDMLSNVGKQIDQIDAKIKNLKNEWDENGNDGEISDEFESENDNHVSKGVIFGKGVLGENAVEIEGAGKDAAGAYLDAFLKEKEDKKNQIAISAVKQANEEATNYQLATTDPNNLAIYDTTERMLAESKQTSQAQGLTDNAYKVIDAETWTLNQAIEAAKQIDFTVIGRVMCEGIANGISANAHLVVSAVKTMMAEANAAEEDETDEGSPSKVYYKHGKMIDLGLANGIRDYASEVSTQVRQMTSRANEAINLANSQMKSERLGTQQALIGAGPTEINYNFVQNNTSNKSLDTLAIYQESKSMLKRAVRNQYV